MPRGGWLRSFANRGCIAFVVTLSLTAGVSGYLTEHPYRDGEKQAEQHERPEDANSQGPIGLAPVVVMPGAISPGQERTTQTQTKEQPNPNYQFFGDGVAQWIMALAGIVATVISMWALCFLKGTLKEAATTTSLLREEFLATNPPRFEVNQINLAIDSWLEDDGARTGFAYAFNKGGSSAEIETSGMVFYVSSSPPPAEPFKAARDANKFFSGTFRAGRTAKWEFSGRGATFLSGYTEAPQEAIAAALKGEGNNTLFVIGRIYFRDTQSTVRHMTFCRKYDPGCGRFVATDDTDYEYHT
jgi:hypothetical protein